MPFIEVCATVAPVASKSLVRGVMRAPRRILAVALVAGGRRLGPPLGPVVLGLGCSEIGPATRRLSRGGPGDRAGGGQLIVVIHRPRSPRSPCSSSARRGGQTDPSGVAWASWIADWHRRGPAPAAGAWRSVLRAQGRAAWRSRTAPPGNDASRGRPPRARARRSTLRGDHRHAARCRRGGGVDPVIPVTSHRARVAAAAVWVGAVRSRARRSRRGRAVRCSPAATRASARTSSSPTTRRGVDRGDCSTPCATELRSGIRLRNRLRRLRSEFPKIHDLGSQEQRRAPARERSNELPERAAPALGQLSWSAASCPAREGGELSSVHEGFQR
jgi:hypothetical protein